MDSQSNYSSLGPGFEPEASHGRIPVWVVLFVSVSLLLAVISMLRFPKVFSEYRFYIKERGNQPGFKRPDDGSRSPSRFCSHGYKAD